MKTLKTIMTRIQERARLRAEALARSGSIKGFIVLCVYFLLSDLNAQMSDPIPVIKSGIGKVIGLIMAIAFIAGLIIVMYGAKKKIDGEPGAYYAIAGGAILAGAPWIIGALYYAFSMKDYTQNASW
jgi:hypothetical protein